MAKTLIILGAGASYDFTHPMHLGVRGHEFSPTFPLTNHLVTNIDSDIEKKYPGFRAIRSLVSSSVIENRKSLEECLEGWDDHEQLIGLLLYLGDFFWKRSYLEKIDKCPSNFLALVNYIKKSSSDTTNIVTFNYDLLLERTIDPLLKMFFNISDYISNKIRIIKIHGSCDWFHLMSQVKDTAYAALTEHPGFLSQPNKQVFTKRWLQQKDSGADKFFHIPVISLPNTSTKSYACPHEHIQLLVDELPETQKILIIGWKAMDTFLLEKLQKIKTPVILTVVSGSKKEAQEVINIVSRYVNVRISTVYEGFSKFIGSDECASFFL